MAKRPDNSRPVMHAQSPLCGSCWVTLEPGDDGGYQCPRCGTDWNADQYDAEGTPWPEWSGLPYEDEGKA